METNKTLDAKIMQELLDQPEVQINVKKMTEAELAFFKEMLVKTGIYARFVRERVKTAGKTAK